MAATIFIIGLLLIITLSYMPYSRAAKIKSIIRDLKALRAVSEKDDLYAIDENIAFFRAIKTLPGYFLWVIIRRPLIRSSQLLEIADLGLARWEKELYDDLAFIERKEFPGLSRPLGRIILGYIKKKPDAIVLDLGCGGMEVERQVLMKLIDSKTESRVIFIGIDSAPQAWDAVKETFSSVGIFTRKIESLNELEGLYISEPTVCFCCGDALKLARQYGDRCDLVFSSRFRHHLKEQQKQELDSISKNLKYVIEYDDYSSKFSWLPPILTAWYRPILLNGAIFSQIRQPSKRDLLREKKSGLAHPRIKFFTPPGSYARIYKSNPEVED